MGVQSVQAVLKGRSESIGSATTDCVDEGGIVLVLGYVFFFLLLVRARSGTSSSLRQKKMELK